MHRFGADCTLVPPRHRTHQFFNVGSIPMQTIGILGASPVVTRLPDGTEFDLPWRS